MLDLIIRNATIPNNPIPMDIGCRNGRIETVIPKLDATAAKELDAANQLVCPTFVDSHFHMDACLSLGLPRLNQSGTLLEGIQLWGELKPDLTPEAIKARAMELLTWSVARGTLAIRTHVDVCDPSLMAVDVLLEVRDFLILFSAFLPLRLCGSSEALRAGVLNSWRIHLCPIEYMQRVFHARPESGPRAAEPQRKGTQREEHRCSIYQFGFGLAVDIISKINVAKTPFNSWKRTLPCISLFPSQKKIKESSIYG